MINNSFNILIRGLWRRKSFSLLNILGLSVGIAASLLIFLLIRNEWSIDRFHPKLERIYRVVCSETFSNGVTDYDGCSPIQLPAALKNEFPQLEQVAATMGMGTQRFTLTTPGHPQGDNLSSEDVYYADPSFFRIFNFPWIAGVPEQALQAPNTAAISRSVANNWFGHWQDAIGATVLMGERRMPFRITGILEDSPPNTDIPLKVVLSYATYRVLQGSDMTLPGNWDDFNSESQCFLLLRNGQSEKSLTALLPGFIERHFTPLYAASHVKDSCFFQPFRQMHFNNRFLRYGKDGWSYSELLSLGLIGVFLLAIACINFINLSTAQSLTRTKEIGVRKVLGSSRTNLLFGFLSETGLLVAVSLILGYILSRLSLPYLNQLLGRTIALSLFGTSSPILFLLITGIALSFLAGFYPGLILSRFDPLVAIKGKGGTRTAGGQTVRRALVVLQFAIAQILLIGTIVVVRQTDFFRNRSMGFQSKAITLIHLPATDQSAEKQAWFKRQVLQIPGVRSASLCDAPPSTSEGWWSGYFIFGNDSHNEDFDLERRYADSDYLNTFRIGLVAGRYPYPSDTIKEIMLNETTVKRLGLKSPADILGSTISLEGRPDKKIPVVGVVHDFNSLPLRKSVRPMALFSAAENFGMLAIRLDPAAMPATISRIRTTFSKTFPGQVFEAPFFDDSVAGFYNAEAITTRLFRIFAALAIFISCLGLYGLVSYMVLQKHKEVGIRKVLGASVRNIVYLFSTEFTLLIGIAFLIAAPLGYYFMSRWLSGYYYHIDLDWPVFLISISSSLFIAWATVGYKAVKAAIADPVDCLRTE